jgi:predicted  nucleic acid-binding Zn-ribbon protein
MVVVKQLNQLQELDLEIESGEQALKQRNLKLGDREELDQAQNKLDVQKQHLNDLKHQQRSTEDDIDDLTSKISAVEEQLYGGKITNPKELSSLQQEVNILKNKRDQKENEALEIMEQAEAAEAIAAAAKSSFARREKEWQQQQQQLAVEIEQLKDRLSDLTQKRAAMTEGIEPQILRTYERLRKQKGQAVARVEQGICRTCRISLSSSQLQHVRSGTMEQCSSCGRILYLP